MSIYALTKNLLSDALTDVRYLFCARFVITFSVAREHYLYLRDNGWSCVRSLSTVCITVLVVHLTVTGRAGTPTFVWCSGLICGMICVGLRKLRFDRKVLRNVDKRDSNILDKRVLLSGGSDDNTVAIIKGVARSLMSKNSSDYDTNVHFCGDFITSTIEFGECYTDSGSQWCASNVARIFVRKTNKFVGYGLFIGDRLLTLSSVTNGAVYLASSAKCVARPYAWRTVSGFSIDYVGACPSLDVSVVTYDTISEDVDLYVVVVYHRVNNGRISSCVRRISVRAVHRDGEMVHLTIDGMSTLDSFVVAGIPVFMKNNHFFGMIMCSIGSDQYLARVFVPTCVDVFSSQFGQSVLRVVD